MDLNDLQALLGETLDVEEYRDLWVIDVTASAGSSPGTEEGPASRLISEARRLADSLGSYVHYVGPADSSQAIAFGADRVHALAGSASADLMAALAELFASSKPEFVLLPASTLSDEIAGRLAQRLGGAALYNCIALRLDEATRELTGVYPVYDGAYYLETAITAKPAIVTLQPDAFPEPYRDPGRSGEVDSLSAESSERRVRAVGRANYQPPPVPLQKAAKVVAVGRAGNTAESVAVARQIAEKIGAHFAGDRSAFDSGWIGHEQIIGVIGTEIAPDIYIAAGIWGDTLHRVGVEGAKYVIAIHPDKNAPIFKYADACILGQPKDVLPALLEKLR